MINDQLSLDFAGASDGMLPTTSCSLPSSSGISFLHVPTNRHKEKRLLPFGWLARAIKPRIGRLAWASKGGNDMGGGILGKRFGEGHGQTIPKKEMSAMQKIILDKCPQCRHFTCMKTTNHYKTSDIKISTDSSGMMTATHKFQGTLDDGTYYESRAECRRQAVKTLKEMKEQGSVPSESFTGGGWGFSN